MVQPVTPLPSDHDSDSGGSVEDWGEDESMFQGGGRSVRMGDGLIGGVPDEVQEAYEQQQGHVMRVDTTSTVGGGGIAAMQQQLQHGGIDLAQAHAQNVDIKHVIEGLGPWSERPAWLHLDEPNIDELFADHPAGGEEGSFCAVSIEIPDRQGETNYILYVHYEQEKYNYPFLLRVFDNNTVQIEPDPEDPNLVHDLPGVVDLHGAAKFLCVEQQPWWPVALRTPIAFREQHGGYFGGTGGGPDAVQQQQLQQIDDPMMQELQQGMQHDVVLQQEMQQQQHQPEKYQEARVTEQNFGRSAGDQFDAWDTPQLEPQESVLSGVTDATHVQNVFERQSPHTYGSQLYPVPQWLHPTSMSEVEAERLLADCLEPGAFFVYPNPDKPATETEEHWNLPVLFNPSEPGGVHHCKLTVYVHDSCKLTVPGSRHTSHAAPVITPVKRGGVEDAHNLDQAIEYLKVAGDYWEVPLSVAIAASSGNAVGPADTYEYTNPDRHESADPYEYNEPNAHGQSQRNGSQYEDAPAPGGELDATHMADDQPAAAAAAAAAAPVNTTKKFIKENGVSVRNPHYIKPGGTPPDTMGITGTEEEVRAAITIQAGFRGHQARQERRALEAVQTIPAMMGQQSPGGQSIPAPQLSPAALSLSIEEKIDQHNREVDAVMLVQRAFRRWRMENGRVPRKARGSIGFYSVVQLRQLSDEDFGETIDLGVATDTSYEQVVFAGQRAEEAAATAAAVAAAAAAAEAEVDEQNSAASYIQARFRGHQQRKKDGAERVRVAAQAPRRTPRAGEVFKSTSHNDGLQDGQLVLARGDVVRFHERVGPGWWEVELLVAVSRPNAELNKIGCAPSRIMELCHDGDAAVRNAFVTAAAVVANYVPPPVEPSPGQLFTAIANAVPQQEGHLELRAGDIVQFHSSIGPLWWEVSIMSLGSTEGRIVTVGSYGTIPSRTVVEYDTNAPASDLDTHL